MLKWLLIFSLIGVAGCGSDELSCAEEGTCEIGDDCEADENCASGLCLAGPAPDPARLVCAEPCDAANDCSPGTCVIFEHDESFDTACAQPVLGSRDVGDACTLDIQCRGSLCLDSRCSKLCVASADCPTDALCTKREVRSGFDAGICEWNPLAPDLTLGPFEFSESGSEPITIEVPEGTSSITVVMRNDDGPEFTRRVGFRNVTAPDGTVLFDVESDDAINPAAIRYPQASVFMAPISDDPRARVQPGGYQVILGVWSVDPESEAPFSPLDGRIEAVDVLFGDGRGGVLDLVLQSTPGAGVELATDSEFVTTLVGEIERHFREVPLVVGEVSFGDLGAESDVLSTSDSVRQMCIEHAAPGRFGASLNVLLVDRLEFASGFTGTWPSPPGLYGYGSSGVVVEVDGPVSEVATVAVHEIGHFLGLAHTTSFRDDPEGGLSRAGFDPISDTPECDVGQLSDCDDSDNLMFPFIDFDADLTLTSGQSAVVGGNPLLYGLRRDDVCGGAGLDITRTRVAAGVLAEGQFETECGSGASAAHVLRINETGDYLLEAEGGSAVEVVDESCSTTLACPSTSEVVTLDPGTYVVRVFGEARQPYRLRVIEQP